MEEFEAITPIFQEFNNTKEFNIKIGEIGYILTISENNTDIKFIVSQKERNDPFEYGEHYNLDKLIKINDIFKMFNSIHAVRKSIESLLNAKKYSFEKNDENLIFTVKINFFEEITDASFFLNKKKLTKEEMEKIMSKQNYEIKELKAEIENLKNKYDNEINKLNKEIKEIKEQNKELINLNQNIFYLFKQQNNELYFNFREGINYTLSNNGKTAKKNKWRLFVELYYNR